MELSSGFSDVFWSALEFSVWFTAATMLAPLWIAYCGARPLFRYLTLKLKSTPDAFRYRRSEFVLAILLPIIFAISWIEPNLGMDLEQIMEGFRDDMWVMGGQLADSSKDTIRIVEFFVLVAMVLPMVGGALYIIYLLIGPILVLLFTVIWIKSAQYFSSKWGLGGLLTKGTGRADATLMILFLVAILSQPFSTVAFIDPAERATAKTNSVMTAEDLPADHIKELFWWDKHELGFPRDQKYSEDGLDLLLGLKKEDLLFLMERLMFVLGAGLLTLVWTLGVARPLLCTERYRLPYPELGRWQRRGVFWISTFLCGVGWLICWNCHSLRNESPNPTGFSELLELANLC